MWKYLEEDCQFFFEGAQIFDYDPPIKKERPRVIFPRTAPQGSGGRVKSGGLVGQVVKEVAQDGSVKHRIEVTEQTIEEEHHSTNTRRNSTLAPSPMA